MKKADSKEEISNVKHQDIVIRMPDMYIIMNINFSFRLR